MEADFALYESELVRSYQSKGAEERPFLLDNCWDLQHVLDWLLFVGTDDEEDEERRGGEGAPNQKKRGRRQKLFNVDASRVGTTGISLGGMHSVRLSFFFFLSVFFSFFREHAFFRRKRGRKGGKTHSLFSPLFKNKKKHAQTTRSSSAFSSRTGSPP